MYKFVDPDYDSCIVGMSLDGNHLIYDYDMMIGECKKTNGVDDETAKLLLEDSVRLTYYLNKEFTPIIITKEVDIDE